MCYDLIISQVAFNRLKTGQSAYETKDIIEGYLSCFYTLLGTFLPSEPAQRIWPGLGQWDPPRHGHTTITTATFEEKVKSKVNAEAGFRVEDYMEVTCDLRWVMFDSFVTLSAVIKNLASSLLLLSFSVK